jgi:asparagine synthase (glutamine-hydrolysing)
MVDRPKMGFGVPIGDWFHGGLGERFRELVLAPDASSRDYLDTSVAAAMLADHQSRATSEDHRLWALLMFELWARRWLRLAAGPDVAPVALIDHTQAPPE